MLNASLRLLVISGYSLSSASCGEFNDPILNAPSSCEDLTENALLAEDAPTFETWREGATQRLPDGTWIFEQDIIIEREDQLRAIYLQHYGLDKSPSGSAFRSIVACSGGFDNVWSVADKLDITYCFGNFSDSGLKSNVESILFRSTMDWERAGDVNFIHVPLSPEECNCIFPDDMQDNEDCGNHSDRARLRVRQADLGSAHPARAGYPGNTTLELLLDSSADNTNENLYRLITHELGHVLGFMHEHLRFDNSNTLSDCSLAAFPWRTVTDPDSKSIMGYGHCGGIEGVTSPDVISPLDRQGAAYVYNLPRNEFPSFTQTAVDDLLWFIPEQHMYTLWRATFNPHGEISFPAAGVSQTCGVLNGTSCFGDH